MNDIKKWLDKEGKIFIKGIGIKKGKGYILNFRRR